MRTSLEKSGHTVIAKWLELAFIDVKHLKMFTSSPMWNTIRLTQYKYACTT